MENYYLVRRAAAPSAIELQHAWLLFNLGNDKSLYPVLTRLEARQDLTAAQREEVESIWGNWSLRRANAAVESGNPSAPSTFWKPLPRNTPNSLNVRMAVASGYVRVGRAPEALAIFKSVPLQM